MKNILITGGAGFIGSNLTRKLVDKGFKVTILDNLSKQIHGETQNSTLYKSIKDIANFIGIPKFITAQFTSIPKQARTSSGRPGWILDENVPSILLVTSPFKSNDIIVTIDGFATNDVNKLKQHLTKKPNMNYFDVEIQRDGNLKMIRVRL